MLLSESVVYRWSSAENTGIAQLYADSQRLMPIIDIYILACALVAVAGWRHVKAKHIKQIRGLVVWEVGKSAVDCEGSEAAEWMTLVPCQDILVEM